ncbi:hypothetical protein [Mariniphaga sp.]|uniref:hypothetical protein n=1 Tax=Mariniphaga sp. TaxID=1954475 RepID=UPI0035681F7F
MAIGFNLVQHISAISFKSDISHRKPSGKKPAPTLKIWWTKYAKTAEICSGKILTGTGENNGVPNVGLVGACYQIMKKVASFKQG